MKKVLTVLILGGDQRYNASRPLGEILQDVAKIDNELGRALRNGLQCATPNDGREVTDGE